MVQAVTKLVEQRGHLIMGQQRRFTAYWRGEVAGQEGHWELHAVLGFTAYPAVGHPRTAPFTFAGVEIQIEPSNRFALFGNTEEAHVVVIARSAAVFFYLNVVKTLDDLEQAIHDPRRGEVGAKLLLGNSVACFAQFLAGVGDIPRFESIDT